MCVGNLPIDCLDYTTANRSGQKELNRCIECLLEQKNGLASACQAVFSFTLFPILLRGRSCRSCGGCRCCRCCRRSRSGCRCRRGGRGLSRFLLLCLLAANDCKRQCHKKKQGKNDSRYLFHQHVTSFHRFYTDAGSRTHRRRRVGTYTFNLPCQDNFLII